MKIRKMKMKNSRAFTLIELLVAISMIGMISLAVLSAFGSGMRVFERVQTYGSIQAEVLIALETLERDLRNTFIFASSEEEGKEFKGIDFIGDGNRIHFAGLIQGFDTGGKAKLSLGAKEYYFDEDAKALMGTYKIYPWVENGGVVEGETLAFVEKMSFTYYYFDPKTEQYAWKSFWDEESEKNEGDEEDVLSGVKIELTFKDGERDVVLERTVFFPMG